MFLSATSKVTSDSLMNDVTYHRTAEKGVVLARDHVFPRFS